MEDRKSELLREAEEVGCFGLLGGSAKNLYSHEEFYASLCTKDDGPFYCPECFSDAVLRKCSEKRDHFAHKSRLTPVIGPEESDLHFQCKNEICELLRQRYPEGNWAVERPIPENKQRKIPELRPDISGRIEGVPVAIEVQASSLTINKIVKRAENYTKKGIALLWIVPLFQPLGNAPFRPRLYERYLHSIYFGRTYYWWAGLGLTVKPVHYDAAIRHVEYREWIGEEGTHMDGGGYDAKFKIVKEPNYGRDCIISDDFYDTLREQFTPENERKTVPSCKIWKDSLVPWWK